MRMPKVRLKRLITMISVMMKAIKNVGAMTVMKRKKQLVLS